MPVRKGFIGLSLLILTACSSSDNSDHQLELASCHVDEQKQAVLDVMNDIYLYYDQLPDVDPSQYSTPEAMLEDMLVAPDRFTYLADEQTQQAFFDEGTYVGFGVSMQVLADNTTLIISSVFDDSSAGRAGWQRGEQIFAIDGLPISDIMDAGGPGLYLGNFKDGDRVTFRVGPGPSTAVDFELEKSLVVMNTVLSAELLERDNHMVGYLALSSFIEPTKSELEVAFAQFQQASIDELVLDLRYNSGGRVSTAQRLPSLIAGDSAVGADTARLEFNDKNTHRNEIFPFESLAQSVDLQRLYVLTLEGTCSASEMVINAMAPVNIEVIRVGQTTCGKPIGSVGFTFCGKVLNPIAFDLVNEHGVGGYFDGLTPTCEASDDLSRNYADPLEGMLSAALFHLENDTCPVTVQTRSLAGDQAVSAPVTNFSPMAQVF